MNDQKEKPVPLEREHGKAGQLQNSARVNGTVQALVRLICAQLLRNGFDARVKRAEADSRRKGTK